MFRLFFSFDGRIRRRAFVGAITVLIIVAAVATVALSPLGVPSLAITLALAYPTLCVIAKRLHDRGHSGWWQVILNIFAKIAGLIGGLIILGDAMTTERMSGEDAPGALIEGVIQLLFLLWLAVIPGQRGSNEFGKPVGFAKQQTPAIEVFD